MPVRPPAAFRAALAALAALVALLVAAPTSGQAPASVRFDGESYNKAFDNRKDAIKVIEYVRPNEDLRNWTRLVAVRLFPHLSDPKQATINLAQVLKKQNPDARFSIITKDDGTEALIDFLTWPAEGDHLEFNIHRYRKLPGVQGLVGYQYAYRFKPSEQGDLPDTLKRNRQRWIDAMLAADYGNPFGR